jgi:hypothetical protein
VDHRTEEQGEYYGGELEVAEIDSRISGWWSGADANEPGKLDSSTLSS